jgi:hypothetical protein
MSKRPISTLTSHRRSLSRSVFLSDDHSVTAAASVEASQRVVDFAIDLVRAVLVNEPSSGPGFNFFDAGSAREAYKEGVERLLDLSQSTQ